MSYKVTVIHPESQRATIRDAICDDWGLMEMLLKFTSLSTNEQTSFVETLIDTGQAEHRPHGRYHVVVMKEGLADESDVQDPYLVDVFDHETGELYLRQALVTTRELVQLLLDKTNLDEQGIKDFFAETETGLFAHYIASGFPRALSNQIKLYNVTAWKVKS